MCQSFVTCMVALHERRESPNLSAQFNLLQPSQRPETPIGPLYGSVSGWRRRRWMVQRKSVLLMSKAVARPWGETSTCGLPALEP